MSFLLDTNVVSEIRKKRPNRGVERWFDAVAASELFVSVLVLGEIRQGIERLARRDSDQAEVFERWLEQLVDEYRGHVVPVTDDVAQLWGRLNVPDPLPVVDGLMAATALAHNWTFVTHNAADVTASGVRLLDPFD